MFCTTSRTMKHWWVAMQSNTRLVTAMHRSRPVWATKRSVWNFSVLPKECTTTGRRWMPSSLWQVRSISSIPSVFQATPDAEIVGESSPLSSTFKKPGASSSAENTEEFLPYKERAKNLVHSRVSGMFTTYVYNDREVAAKNIPLLASLMPYILDEESRFIFGLLEGEKHLKNIEKQSFASMMIYTLTPTDLNPAHHPVARLSLSGKITTIEDAKKSEEFRKLFLETHPGSKDYVNDYKFYQLEADQIIYVDPEDGNVVIDNDEFHKAPVDPFSSLLRFMLPKMNQDRPADLIKLCQIYADTEVKRAVLTNVDRRAMEILAEPVENPKGATKDAIYWNRIRMPFPEPIHSLEQFRDAFNESLQK